MPGPTPEDLRSFFLGKGHKNLVLRLAEARRLPQNQQDDLRDILRIVGFRPQPPEYLVLPWDRLGTLPMERLEALQRAVYAYRDIRGLQEVETPCAACGGAGCRDCEGAGVTTVMQEMTPEEVRMAEGRGE